MYVSYTLTTSNGECIASTGVPQSITSIPLFASIYAIVPPPPFPCFPSTPNWYITSFLSNICVTSDVNFAVASLALYLPLPPVYF